MRIYEHSKAFCMETSPHRPTLGAWIKVILYTFHQFLRVLSNLFAIVPIFGRVYIIRIALTYLAAFLTVCALGLSLLRALAGIF